jgi:predicted DNA-binding transcriptional regulator AlpA
MSELLTPAEVAARLRISQTTLARWRRQSPIRGPEPIKLGPGGSSRVRYRRADVDALIDPRESPKGSRTK